MKSLKESLFDDDLVTKDLTIGQIFNIFIDRHKASCPTMNDDKKIVEKIKKDVDSIKLNLKTLDCSELIKILTKLSEKYTKNWLYNGGYKCNIFDKSNHVIKKTNMSLNDAYKISLYNMDLDKNNAVFITWYILTRK